MQLASGKKNAWEQFTKQFPNADKTQFFAQTSVDENYKISAEVFFKEIAAYSSSVFGSDRKYWSQKMKNALGVIGAEGFSFQLSPLKTKRALPIPAVEFTESAPSIAKIFNQENRIYATPDEFFVTKFRDIFQKTQLTHRTSAEAKTWLGGPKMKFILFIYLFTNFAKDNLAGEISQNYCSNNETPKHQKKKTTKQNKTKQNKTTTTTIIIIKQNRNRKYMIQNS